MKNYYQILNIPKKASSNEIKKAYRILALKWHPDKNKDDIALDKFREISEAFHILSDEQKKLEYDKQFSNKEYINHDLNYNFFIKDPFEIFNEVFSIFNNMHDSFMAFDPLFNLYNSNMIIHIINMDVDNEFENYEYLNTPIIFDLINETKFYKNNNFKKNISTKNRSKNNYNKNNFNKDQLLLKQNDSKWNVYYDNETKISILNDKDFNQIINKILQ